MPVHIEKQKGKYCVVEPDGSIVKCHATKEAAKKHMAAININTAEGGGPYGGDDPSKLKKKKRKESKKADAIIDLEPSDPPMPKVVIVSDGDFGSTRLFIRGQEVPVNDIHLSAYKGNPDSDYEFEKKDEFSLSMSTNRVVDGMEQTITLRLREKAALEFIDNIAKHTPRFVRSTIAKLLDQEINND